MRTTPHTDLAVSIFRRSEGVTKLLTDVTATIYTSDIARALRVASKLEAGTVGINSAFNTSPQTPFGGFKQSGYGRESGPEGLKEYLQPKTIHVNLNVPPPKR